LVNSNFPVFPHFSTFFFAPEDAMASSFEFPCIVSLGALNVNVDGWGVRWSVSAGLLLFIGISVA